MKNQSKDQLVPAQLLVLMIIGVLLILLPPSDFLELTVLR